MAWDSFAEWYQRGDYAPFVAEARLPADSPVQMVLARQPAGRFPDPATPDLVLQLMTHASGEGYADLGASRGWTQARAGTLSLAPPDTACDYEMTAPFELMVLALPAGPAFDVLREVSGGALTDFGPVHDHRAHGDLVVESLMRRLWIECDGRHGLGALYAQDAATAVAARLARLAVRASGLPDAAAAEEAPPLGGAKLNRVLRLIDERMEGELRQEDLAQAAGLSPWHFCRAFKAGTGVAPHRYVLLRRLARSQQLLRGSSEPIAGVAAACGFASHAHLSPAFKTVVGARPAAWRRAVAA